MSLRQRLFAAALALAALLPVGASAETSAPFAQGAAPKPKVLRLLAFPGLFDPATLEAFEQATGYAVGYDDYALALEIPEKWKDGPYDVVIMPGPALARRIAAGALQKLDRRRLPNAKLVQSAVDAKLAVHDPGDAYGVPLGWAPYGLIYNTEKAQARLGAPPNSWAALLDPKLLQALGECGGVAPNARDAMFVAAWRYAGVDPARLRPLDIKSGAALLARAKPALQGFALPDPVGALARGGACLTLGTPGEAAAANLRARNAGGRGSVAFVEPKEGGGVEVEAFAIPRDAPHPDLAYRLIDYLLSPEVARRNAAASGLASSEAPAEGDLFKRLWPLGAFDEAYGQAMEAEWTRLRTSK